MKQLDAINNLPKEHDSFDLNVNDHDWFYFILISFNDLSFN